MVAGNVPDNRRSPIVAYPDRLFLAYRIEELDHVGNYFVLGIGVCVL
jgi:hypothetical protein